MTSKVIITAICLVSFIGLVSCKNGKQAKKVIDTVRKEYKALNESEGVRYLKYKHRYETAKEYINSYNSYSLCYRCNGYGVLYLVDEYGYPVTDYNGNYQFVTCDNCGGNGYE